MSALTDVSTTTGVPIACSSAELASHGYHSTALDCVAGLRLTESRGQSTGERRGISRSPQLPTVAEPMKQRGLALQTGEVGGLRAKSALQRGWRAQGDCEAEPSPTVVEVLV